MDLFLKDIKSKIFSILGFIKPSEKNLRYFLVSLLVFSWFGNITASFSTDDLNIPQHYEQQMINADYSSSSININIQQRASHKIIDSNSYTNVISIIDRIEFSRNRYLIIDKPKSLKKITQIKTFLTAHFSTST